MTAPIITLADAVVTALNDATLSQDFTAARQYVPKFDLHSSAAVQVAVVPKADAREMGAAAFDTATTTIDVGVMKKLTGAVSDESTEIDGMMDLCEEIKALLNRQRLGGSSESVCIVIVHEPIYSVEEVDEKRNFLTVISASFLTPITV